MELVGITVAALGGGGIIWTKGATTVTRGEQLEVTAISNLQVQGRMAFELSM